MIVVKFILLALFFLIGLFGFLGIIIFWFRIDKLADQYQGRSKELGQGRKAYYIFMSTRSLPIPLPLVNNTDHKELMLIIKEHNKNVKWFWLSVLDVLAFVAIMAIIS